MNIEQAKQLKAGDRVACPADRGEPSFTGRVTSVGSNISKNLKGAEFVWVEVQGPHHKSVWPSNRLGAFYISCGRPRKC